MRSINRRIPVGLSCPGLGLVALLFLLLSFPALLNAEIHPHRFSVSTMVGEWFYDHNLPSDLPLKKYHRHVGVVKFG